MRISDWSSDVCSSDLEDAIDGGAKDFDRILAALKCHHVAGPGAHQGAAERRRKGDMARGGIRSEEHTSELQSLMRISYAVFCLKKKKNTKTRSQCKRSTYNETHTSCTTTHTNRQTSS